MMLVRLALAACLALVAPAAHAACAGQDLRQTLAPAERAEMQARIAGTPHATGNHWLAERGGTRIHLIGTVHLADPRLDPVMDRLRPLLDRARVILLEMTPEEEAELQRAIAARPDMMFINTGPTLIELLPAPVWQDLAQAATDRGVPGFMAAKFQPWYLSMLLAIPPCAMTDLAGGAQGLDRRIAAHAQDSGVPLRALEPYDTLFRLFAAEPMERQLDFLRLALQPEGAAEDGMATAIATYFDEAHAEVWEMSRLQAHRTMDMPGAEIEALMDEMRAELLDGRNRDWLPRILRAADMAGDGPVIVAAGAAHLTGAAGLPALLAAEGFSLTRLPF